MGCSGKPKPLFNYDYEKGLFDIGVRTGTVLQMLNYERYQEFLGVVELHKKSDIVWEQIQFSGDVSVIFFQTLIDPNWMS